jgi:hypothetical protein
LLRALGGEPLVDWCRRNPRSANLRSRAQSDARALLVHWFLRLRTFGLEGGLSIKEAGTQPGLWFKPFLFYLQQRNGFLSLELVVKPPPQELPLSTAGLSEKLKAWVPAKIGQSPPQVKQRLHATAVCAFATSGASLGAGFPPNWRSPLHPLPLLVAPALSLVLRSALSLLPTPLITIQFSCTCAPPISRFLCV